MRALKLDAIHTLNPRSCYKTLLCHKRSSHDWKCCPFAHPGEKGRRRSLSKVWYEAVMCGYVRRGETCPLGDGCGQVGVCVGGWL